ncbi:MupG family TIM beta-alpha barrel fold protein [Oceanirhabdus sp. W0125-5]|uniref:MupG family TIM beta-alpha barrel fold protein n=1 Tax=Oceanirhabdus sp. W0125-5 TaxID=2999116 RepID=UPI0022F31A06|nr:MupG family TIM beta-alpha barrel fold protein [Oceanirhabdus sp. W0125-5]WBW99209.1 MupG family TIM beta-alpha barrel fold protein [Oceanirhabdus sp. W0125-5]
MDIIKGLFFILYDNESFESILQQIEIVNNFNYNRIFLRVIEGMERKEYLKGYIYRIIQKVKEKKLDLILQVDEDCLNIMDESVYNLKDLYLTGVSGIFYKELSNIEQICEISYNDYIHIFVGWEILNEKTLKYMGEKGANFRNLSFVLPQGVRVFSGISVDEVINTLEILKGYSSNICAFLDDENGKNRVIPDGISTVEELRGKNSLVSYKILNLLGIRKFFIHGTIGSEQLKKINDASESYCEVRIRLFNNNDELAKKILFSKIRRITSVNRCGVISFGNIKKQMGLSKIESSYKDSCINIGDITIDNCLYGINEGELNIYTRNSDRDERINKIASIIEEDVCLLSYITQETLIKFVLEN